LFRIADKLAPAGAGSAHLQDGVFLDLDVVRDIGRFGVETAGWQDLQLGAVKRVTVAGCEYARQDGDFAGIRMRVGRNLEALREFEARRVRPWPEGIADQIELLHSRSGKRAL